MLSDAEPTMPVPTPTELAIFVSGYTEDGAGPGLGCFKLMSDGSVGEKRSENPALVNPSFVIFAGDYLVAVQEKAVGSVVVLDPLTLKVVGTAPTGGADSCHAALIGDFIWSANYSSGTTSVLPLAGVIQNNGAHSSSAPLLLEHPGSGPVAGRQSQSHAHQVTPTPWGTALVSDLGADRVDEYALAPGDFALLRSAQFPPGTGPRHVALKGDFMLVSGELDGYLHVLRKTPSGDGDADEYFWRWLFKTALAKNPQDLESAAEFYPSHIQLSDDGSKLYAAVRGPNTVLVLDVSTLESAGAGGEVPRTLGVLSEVSSAGNWPRHFGLSPAKDGRASKLYVANQLSNTVAVFDLDKNGLPGTEPVQTLDFGSPSCILIA